MKTTVQAAFLVKNSLGKEARLILPGADTQHYLAIQKVLSKALAEQVAWGKDFNKRRQEKAKEFRDKQGFLLMEKPNASPERQKQIEMELQALQPSFNENDKPFEQESDAYDEKCKTDTVELIFDRNDFTWLSEFLKKNAISFCKNQDGSINNEALELITDFANG